MYVTLCQNFNQSSQVMDQYLLHARAAVLVQP